VSGLKAKEGRFDPELLLQRAGWLRGLAGRLVHDTNQADDLAQETLLAAIEKPPRSVQALGSWLSRVLRNLARLHHRQAVNRFRRETAAARPERQGPTPAELVERAEIQERLFRLVLELDEPYRSTVLQCFFEELTPAEVARREGLPATTVRSRLSAALERLRLRMDSAHAGGRQAWRSALLTLVDPQSLLTRGSAGANLSGGGAAGAKLGSAAWSWLSMGGVLLTQKSLIFGVASAAVLLAGIGIGRRTVDSQAERARLAGVQAHYQRAAARIRSLEEEKAAGKWRSLLLAGRARATPLPAAAGTVPQPSAASPAPETAPDEAASLKKLLLGDKEAMKATELSADEIERTLEKNGRETQFLIAAAQLSKDPDQAREYLEEALEKDPAYSPALLALLELQMKTGDPAEAVSATIERLRAADPENALASSYSAQLKFQAGDARGALDDMLAAISRPKVNDYNPRHYETFQSFYRDSGRGEAEAKLISAFELRMGYLPALRELSKAASAEASRLLLAGDGASAEAYTEAAARLASKVSASGHSLLHHVVVLAMENEALEVEKKVLAARGATEKAEEVDRRIEEGRIRLSSYRKIAGAYLPALADAPASEVSRFFDLAVREGEVSAALDLAAVREAIKDPGR
jgi:RNA polymerase sigma factor (sigma-70 family)